MFENVHTLNVHTLLVGAAVTSLDLDTWFDNHKSDIPHVRTQKTLEYLELYHA